MLTYREIYDRWERSKSFGDPRDISTYAADLNKVTGTNDFDAAVKPSWWKQASTQADVKFFEPVAKATGFEDVGGYVGKLFGGRGEEIGKSVGRSLPRMFAQTIPLIAGEVLSGGAATPVVAGALATGGLFGAQTYAETGSPTAAAVSGATAAALPGVGRIGGSVGLKLLGPEVERGITKVGQRFVQQTLPKEAGQTLRYKAARFAGSQAAQIGTLEGSSALQSKVLGTPFDPLSPEFLAQQIPFSFLDLATTLKAKVPTAKEAFVPPILPPQKTYIPPKSDPVMEANVQDMLDRLTSVAKDQTVAPEEKSKIFEQTLGVILSPTNAVAKADDRVILVGVPKKMENGSIKLYVTDSKFYDLPEHKNVFINNPETAVQRTDPTTGLAMFVISRKNVNANVKYPLGAEVLGPMGQETLKTAPPPTGAGIAPETDLLSLRQKFQKLVRNETMFQTALSKEPKNADQAVAYWQQTIDKMTPEHLKPGSVSPFDSGEQQVMREAGVEPSAIAEAITPQAEPRVVPALTINEPDGIADRSNKASSDELIRMVREGEKPAATLGNNGNDTTSFGKPYSLEEAQGWVNRAKEQGLVAVVHQVTDKEGNVIGYDALAGDGQDSVDKLQKALTRDPNRSYADKQTQIGEALGYSPEDIKRHVDHLIMQGRDKEQAIKSSAQKIETSHATAADAQEKLNLVPRTMEDVQTLFHGTTAPVQKFTAGKPVYLTSDLGAAKSYARYGGFAGREVTDKSRVLKVTGQFEKVADYTVVEQAIKDLSLKDSVDEILFGMVGDSEKVFDHLSKQGYDAIRYFDQHAGHGDVIDATIALKPEKLQVEMTRAALKQSIDSGASPAQAVEKVRLQTQTPIVDEAKQQINLSQADLREQLHEQLLALSAAAKPVTEPLVHPETGKPLTLETPEERRILREAANKRLKAAKLSTGGVAAVEGKFPEKPSAIYGEPIRDENGKNFKTRALAEAYRDSDPDLEGYTVRDAGKRQGFYLAKQVNVETSIQGEPGTSLENVLKAEEPTDIRDTIVEEAATTPVNEALEIFVPPAEDRPPVSFTDYLGQLDRASKNPLRLRNAAGFDDLPTAITAIRQFRTALTEVFTQGKDSLKDVNAALKKAGVLSFESEKEMKDTFRKMRSGLEEFTDRYRSFALDSKVPHDVDLVNEIGVLHPERGATNFLDWFISNSPSDLVRDLATGLRKFSDFSHINLTNDEGKGTWYAPTEHTKGKPIINLGYLPADRADALGGWGQTVLHELAHDTVADLHLRTDPAAVSFKAELQRILKVLRDSRLIPDEVRKAVKLSSTEQWAERGAEFYNKRFDEHLPGRDSWKGVHYALSNEYELLSGIFNSPELVRIMRETKMPKSPVSVLNFFANAWARMFGYTPNAENAFAKLIDSYDNYLSGTKNARGYNGMSYIRDSLVAVGTHPQGMSSRMKAVQDVYSQGDLSGSIRGYERERDEAILPTTTVAGAIDENLKTALVTGDATAVKEATASLLAENVPQHEELWLRMKEDLQIAKSLHEAAKKGQIFAETSLFQEGLKNQGAKLNAMKSELDRHKPAIERWNAMESLTNSEGIHRMWSSNLGGKEPPKPTEQTGNEDIAHQALNLAPKGAEYIAVERRRLATTGEKPLNFIDRNAKFASFVAQEQAAFKPIYQNMLEAQANAHRRMSEMEVVRNSDAKTKGWNKAVAKANQRVAETPGLNRIVSDMLLRAQIMEKMKVPVSLDDSEMQTALRRASNAKNRNGRSDRDDVITAFNSEGARFSHRVDAVIPQHFDIMNRMLTALAIIGREIGMPSTKAIELSEQLHMALRQLRDPAQQVQGAEGLRFVATQMQPENFVKVLQQSNGFIEDSQKHLKLLQTNRHYVSEQRYGKFHLVMSREGEPYREGFPTEKAARARAKILEDDGWTLEDIVPIEQANVRGFLRAEDPVIASQRELDQQTLNRMESLIADLPAERQDALRPLVQRAAEYESSAAAFAPVPTQASPRRKFRAGRETLDMMANAAEDTKRFVNWMRHREARVGSAIHMLDPEMLANRSLKQYATQFVDNQLATDNPIARRISEGAFYWYLAANFGNDVLESMQSLTTGMASVIGETGSVKDAVKYIAGASAKVFRRYATGKWGSPDTEWFINWLSSRGSLGLPTWGDVFDPTTQNYFDVTRSKNAVGKTLDAFKHGLRGYKALFIRHNDMVGGLAGFQLGRDLGMQLEDAARFAEGVKNRGLYSAGKVQRPVGLWSIKEKAVPQLMSSLKTYIMGYFSQLAHNYKVGFANAPGDYTPTQRIGAKKAFLYMLGAQATLAGSLGLPGIGQALALLKQTTGVDTKGWARKNLAAMFGEDQDDYGGFFTGLALHGLLATAAPFDISGRQVTDIPFTGVSSWKGFDMSNIIPVPFSMASDFLGGLGNLAKGGDPSKAFPMALRGPAQLIHGGGDIRNSRGDLLYNLAPSERVLKVLGLEPTRVAAAKETAATIQSMNDAAAQRKTSSIEAVADLYRRGDQVGARRRMADIKRENPTYDMTDFVRSVALKVEKQTFPYDWKREVNPALDIIGLSSNQPSREVERQQFRRNVSAGLGLYERPNLQSNIRSAALDQLLNADPYLTRSVALQHLLATRRLQRPSVALEPAEYQ